MRNLFIFLSIMVFTVMGVVAPLTTMAQTAPVIDVASAQAFVGTWVSGRDTYCGPCIIKIEDVKSTGQVLGTWLNNFGESNLQGSLVVRNGKIVLTFVTPRGYPREAELPSGNYLYVYAGPDSFRYTRQ